MSESSSVFFTIETEVAPAYYEELLTYVSQKYLQPSPQRFANVKRSDFDGEHVLDFTFLESHGNWQVNVNVKTGHLVQVTMTPSQTDVPKSALDQLKEDLIIVIQYFEEYVRRSTLYFAWVQGRDVVPEKSLFRRAKVIERIFFGNMLFLFILLIAVSIVLFIYFNIYAAIVIVVGQLLIVLFADRLVGTLSDWPITKENPTVHILQYHLPAEERKDFAQKYRKERLLQMKKEIYDKTIAVGKPIETATCGEVMSKYGLSCAPENMVTKTVNVYELVEKTTARYGMAVPKIALSNTMVPNAAASGVSASHGIVLITTGLLVQLDQEEIVTVLGHEISHLHGRDPFVLFGIIGGEYLVRVFVLLPYIQSFALIYVIFILGLIYFVAKFFEARADLESAIKVGNPKILAGALRKIGFRRLQYERSPSYKIQDWITLDPHPPIYFRVERLEKLDTTKEVRHTLIRSAEDCIRGFFAAF